MNAGTLYILNGGSSHGKSSVAAALQDLADRPTLVMGIDLFWYTIPQKQLDATRADPDYYTFLVNVVDGRPTSKLKPGPLLDRLMLGRYRAISNFLDLGFDVIADDAVCKQSWLTDALEILQSYRVYFIGVYCDDAVTAEREKQRGNRSPGAARGSSELAHAEAIYDLTIDTSHDSPQACAQRIRDARDGGLQPTAKEQMIRKFLGPLS